MALKPLQVKPLRATGIAKTLSWVSFIIDDIIEARTHISLGSCE